jgi:hypothetical protein
VTLDLFIEVTFVFFRLWLDNCRFLGDAARTGDFHQFGLAEDTGATSGRRVAFHIVSWLPFHPGRPLLLGWFHVLVLFWLRWHLETRFVNVFACVDYFVRFNLVVIARVPWCDFAAQKLIGGCQIHRVIGVRAAYFPLWLGLLDW